MFCSCCRDVQSAGSTLEFPVEDKGNEPHADHAEASRGVEANARADGRAALSPRSPTAQPHGVREQAQGTTSDAAAERRTVMVSSPRDSTRSGATFKQPKAEPAPAFVPLTLQHGDKARRTSAPTPGTLGAGAYLVYDKENDTMCCQWSTAPLPTALAWLMPIVQVPTHKYNVNKGKQVLARECMKTGKYFQGWVSFIKITREYPSKLMLLDNIETSGAPAVRIFLLEISPDQAGAAFAREVNEPNKLYDLVNNIKAVAAVPASSTLLTPNEAIDSKVFIQKGSGIGAALAFGA